MMAQEQEKIFCARCGEEILERPTRQDNELFCTVECANLASGHGTEEPEEYFDEADLEGLYEEEEDS